MSLAFMVSLLCAITDCPPPSAVHHSNANQNPGFLNPFPNLLGSASGNVERQVLGRSLNDFTSGSQSSTFFIDEFPFVTIKNFGDVQGKFMKSRKGRRIAAFQGIPYALPPTKNLRFRNPVPPWPWFGQVLVANKTKSDCLQLDFSRLFQVRGKEDCLYLNVYSPVDKETEKAKKLLPVIVFIHGGGWMSTSGNPYGPRYLLDRDVILVTLNFRLGVLGFLSTGDSHARGNWQLQDQLLALKFVKDNIEDFGGDSKRITLVGESTGAGAVGLHLLSPVTSREIPIYGAVMLSGSSLNHWSIMNDTIANTKAIAKRMLCPTERSDQLVECLRRHDPYLLVGQQLHLWTVPTISRLLFGPVLESMSQDNPHPFISEAPEVIYEHRQNSINPVPVITGIDKDEGALFAANVYLVPFLFRTINQNRDKMLSYIMAYDRLPGVNATQVSEKISQFYLKGDKWSFKNRHEIGNALGDRTITTGVYNLLKQHSKIANTYGYYFAYPSKKSSVLSQQGLRSSDWGVSHGDELHFIFSMDQMFEDFTSPEDLAVSKFMVNLLANFASNRQPFPLNVAGNQLRWSPILNPKYNMELLEINIKRKMISFPYKERMDFWSSLKVN